MCRAEIKENILSATVTFNDTGDTYVLKTRPGSACHFFERFEVGDDYIQLRLDWRDLDQNGQPTLDADFINRKTHKHRSLRGKRLYSHHTASLPGKGRSYEWKFNGFGLRFSVKVIWLASASESFQMSDFLSAEMISEQA